ncbi:myotrophin-like [Ruditapes philippinarum]|uniref:myotrophin-like n=1 Tax=Ruditapes philippinarum TaxID=129788 RepID=UPI00295B2774|nr:myotrophin-like [Ruditapes philippinarum]XP_060576491.1 myotrophin-like [Ruditapes philippinarum]
MSEELVWGVKNGDIDAVKKEIENKKGDINTEVQGRTALHFAADYGQTDVITCLLDNGADINKPDKHGISPLLAAIWENHTDAVKLLLERGASKEGKAPDGTSYYDCAETDDIKELLKKK